MMATFIALLYLVYGQRRRGARPRTTMRWAQRCLRRVGLVLRRGLRFLPTAVPGAEHQVAQERLFVDPQQVRLVALDVGADDVPVRSDAHQMTEGLRIPLPRQFQFAERAVVGLEFRGEQLARRNGRHGFADNVWHRSLPILLLTTLPPVIPEEKLKLSIATISFSEYLEYGYAGGE